jgi:hypothetical protein
MRSLLVINYTIEQQHQQKQQRSQQNEGDDNEPLLLFNLITNAIQYRNLKSNDYESNPILDKEDHEYDNELQVSLLYDFIRHNPAALTALVSS